MTADPDPHLTAGELAAYVDGMLTPVERDRVETHLASCTGCREEVMAVHRLAQAPVRRRLPAARLVGLAAAAVIAIVTFRMLWTPPSEPRSPVRADTSPVSGEPVAGIAAWSPLDGDTISAREAVFRWAPVGGNATFQLRLSEPDGSIRWTWTTPDTSATLPDTVHLSAGSTYLWYVDALQADGRSASTGVRRFVIR